MIIPVQTLTTVPVEGMLRNLFVLRLYAIGGQLLALLAAYYGLNIALPLPAMLGIVAMLAIMVLAVYPLLAHL